MMEKNRINLSLKNICKSFKSKEVLRDINLEFNEGDLVCIVGESGIGKTVLLNIINLLEKYDQGTYFINGEDVKKVKSKKIKKYKNKLFGRIFQDFKLIDEYTVFENIEIPLVYSKERMSYSKRREKIRMLAEKFNMDIDLDARVKNLSGGEKQRISIIRGIVNDQDIILADEFSSALDVKNRDFIFNIFKQLSKEGKIVIAVSHDLSIVDHFDRIINLEKLLEFRNKEDR